MIPIPFRLPTTTLALASAALLAGCGGDDETATTAPADGTIRVTAKDFAFGQEELEAKAGKVTIELANEGPSEHELVLLETDAEADALPVEGGRVPEDGTVGEVAEIASGKTGSHAFDLRPGRYVYVCNIPGHYGDGMRGTLTVK